MAAWIGTEGDDLHTAGDGNDVLDGLGGNDTLDGGLGSDTLHGGAGDDRLEDGARWDAQGPDFQHRNLLDGGDGNDWLNADQSDDTLLGGAGNDTLHGGGGNDWMEGGDGDDLLTATDRFGPGYHLPHEGAQLFGGAGNDRLVANTFGPTVAWMTGGAGADVFEVDALGRERFITRAVDRVLDFNLPEGDRIDLRTPLLAMDAAGPGLRWGGLAPEGFHPVPDAEVPAGHGLTLWAWRHEGREGLYIDANLNGRVDDSEFVLEVVRSQPADLSLASSWGFTLLNELPPIRGTEGDDTLSGTNQADRIEGLGGQDTLYGQGGDDWLDGGAGDDSLSGGGSGADTLVGGTGNDHLEGGAWNFGSASDWLWGGSGDDVLIATAAGGAVLNGETGVDQFFIVGELLRTSLDPSVSQPLHLRDLDTAAGERIELSVMPERLGTPGARLVWAGAAPSDFHAALGQTAPNLAGEPAAQLWAWRQAGSGQTGLYIDRDRNGLVNEGDFVMWVDGRSALTPEAFGLGGVNRTGSSGSDVMTGTGFDDVLSGGDGSDLLNGGGGNDQLYAGVQYGRSSWDDTLRGGDGNDELFAGRALAGQAGRGSTLMVGGAGNDRLVGRDLGDTASFEDATQGIELQLDAAGNGTASGEGQDTLLAIDGVIGSRFADRLVVAIQHASLSGGAGNDWLESRADNATFVGGTGADTLVGSGTFFVDDPRDTIVLRPGGSGWVDSTSPSFRLPDGISSGRIAAQHAANLYGNASDNLLYAGSGDNVLYGGAGVDTVAYGYNFDSAAVVVDLSRTDFQDTGGSGRDRLVGIENLVGSAYSDRLTGNAGANRLDGADGNDTLVGGDGSDTYVVNLAGDGVIETNPDRRTGGTDTVILQNYFDPAGYRLPAHVENGELGWASTKLFGNALDNLIEAGQASYGDVGMAGLGGRDTLSYAKAGSGREVDLSRQGPQTVSPYSRHDISGFEDLIGSSFADRLSGDAQGNVLRGGNGADTLRGGLGNDALFGGRWSGGDGAADHFVFDTAPDSATNHDRVFGFEADGLDRIVLDPALYAAFGARIDEGEFRIGTQALDADDFLLYDPVTGNLYYDPDGNGAAPATAFARLIGAIGSVDASDFTLSNGP